MVFLVAGGLLSVVDGTEPKPEDTTSVAVRQMWTKNDAKAMSVISSSLEYSQLEYLIMCNSVKRMWDKLSALHEQKSEYNKLTLMTKFHEYRMTTSNSVA